VPSPDRPDPVDLLEAQAKDRLPDLVPIRYARMMASPFAFMRGSAIIMAHDLASTPETVDAIKRLTNAGRSEV
jgi:uncharacterized protein (DUF2252 family)